MESETGTPGSLGGAPSAEEEAAATQLVPAALETLGSKAQASQTTAGSTVGP